MSFDLGVWYSDVPMTVEQARSYFEHINGDWVDVRRRAAFDEFLKALEARFPDLRSPDDPPADPDEPPKALLMSGTEMKSAPPPGPDAVEAMRKRRPPPEDSPWAASLTPHGAGIALSIRGSKVGKVAPMVVELALGHRLVVYDPQDDRVLQPPALAGRPAEAGPVPRLQLDVAGNAPAVQAKITLDGGVVLDETLPSRREAHRRARALTLENKVDFYAVSDPGSLAQGMVWEPIPPGDPRYPPASGPNVQFYELKPAKQP
jgi:hypothetical protein